MFSDSHAAKHVSTSSFTVLPKFSVRIALYCFNNWRYGMFLTLSMIFLKMLLEVVGTAEVQINNAPEQLCRISNENLAIWRRFETILY